jgi:hypothetical protein
MKLNQKPYINLSKHSENLNLPPVFLSRIIWNDCISSPDKKEVDQRIHNLLLKFIEAGGKKVPSARFFSIHDSTGQSVNLYSEVQPTLGIIFILKEG